MANENAIVNTTPTVSETPSNLVAEKENELSPNPAGFGFTKQLVVNSLPSPGVPNVLYLVPQYNGEGHVKEYYKYKWDVYKSAYERIFEPVNNVSYEKSEHATPVVENTAPTEAPEKVFNGVVAFNKEPSVEGSPLSDWIDKQAGGVTEQELHDAIDLAIYGAIDADY